MSLLEQYKEKQKKISYLGHAASLMNWDKETTTPEGGMEKLAEAINYFQTEIFKLSTSDETFDLVCKLAEPEEFNKLDDVMQFDIKRNKRDLEKMRKLPQEVFEEYVKATTKASIVWPSAKRASDFSKFEKELEAVIEAVKKYHSYVNPDKQVYDALIDQFEEGMTQETIDRVFGDLRK